MGIKIYIYPFNYRPVPLRLSNSRLPSLPSPADPLPPRVSPCRDLWVLARFSFGASEGSAAAAGAADFSLGAGLGLMSIEEIENRK